MEKSFNFSLCFYVIRHATSRFCLILSYLIFAIRCAKMQKDTIRCKNSNVVFLISSRIGKETSEQKISSYSYLFSSYPQNKRFK